MNDLMYYIDQINSASDNAEINVMESLIMTYSKANMILESSSNDIDISSFDIFSESFKDDLKAPILGNKDESVAKRILMVIPRLIAKLLSMIKQLISRNKRKEKECKEIARNIQDTLKKSDKNETTEKPKNVMVDTYFNPDILGLNYPHEVHMIYKSIKDNLFDAHFYGYKNNPKTTMSQYLYILKNDNGVPGIIEIINMRLKGLETLTNLEKRSHLLSKNDIETWVEKMLAENDKDYGDAVLYELEDDLEDIQDSIDNEYYKNKTNGPVPKHAMKEFTADRNWVFYDPADMDRVIQYIQGLIERITKIEDAYWKQKTDDLHALQEAARSF